MFTSQERTSAEERWSEICKYVLPNQKVNFQNVADTAPGEKKSDGVYTSEAMVANRDLAAFIRDFSDPTERPVFRFIDEAINNDSEAIQWLDQCTYILHRHMSDSNLSSESSKNYHMFPALGNMVLLQESKPPLPNGKFGGFTFRSIHLAEITWSENAYGKVDTVFRKLSLTAKQALEMFGEEAVSEKILKDIEQCKYEEIHQFIHCVYPRVLPGKKSPLNLVTSTDMPFESIYIEKSAAKIVREDGYSEFPFFVTRWDTAPGEVTGRGPGHVAEAEIKTLNKFVELSLTAFHNAVHHTWVVDQRNAMSEIDFTQGQTSIVADINGIRSLRENTDLKGIDYVHSRFTETIQKIFYLDKLYLPPRTDTGEMSAYEVARRMEQAHKVLGPTAGRLNNEFLSPMLIRSFSMLLRSQEFPEVPDILKINGIDIQVDFISQMVRSQKLRDGTAIQGWINSLGAMAQVLGPEIIDSVQTDQAALILGRSLGVPEVVIRSDEEVAAIRDSRAKAAQQNMELEQGVKMADMNAKLKGSQ